MSTPDIRAEILAAEQARCDALVAKDRAALDRLMADDCLVLHGSGVIEGKEPFLAAVFNRLDIKAISRDSQIIRVYGSTAVVTCVQTMELTLIADPDRRVSARANVSAVWHRDDNGWRLNTLHNTRLEP